MFRAITGGIIKEHGGEKTCIHFGVKPSTLVRYFKEAKRRKKSWRMPKILLLDIGNRGADLLKTERFDKTVVELVPDISDIRRE